ncbi:MAG: NADH-quinone oxidoreductase subunit J [Deltaproteobacteria bacterium]|nr:NADH-quinone oxidoreductase subunit J [Deltaproteobacteria bacterium]
MADTILFYLFGGLSVIMVLLMIFQTNPVASAMYLVGAFFGLAALFVLLSAPFVAVLQVLVYAGAIMVLFTFVIMLMNIRKEELIDDRVTWKKIAVVLIALFFAGFLSLNFLKIPADPFAPVEEGFGEVGPVGRLMFLKYLIPFELTSILLLTAIIGAMVLGKKEE